MVSSFEDLGLSADLVRTVETLHFEQPTPIQASAIPVMLSGRDLIGQAQTGTGKTAAFGLPILERIQSHGDSIQSLILAPTRELALQVAEAVSRMAERSSIRVLAVYGGQSYQIQTRQLDRGVDIVVGTPGRLLDLLRQKRLDISRVHYLVLDEADEMLEMGFIEDVEEIFKNLPAERQTALFSATMPDAVRRLANRYLDTPEHIQINPTRMTVAETEQHFILLREESKLAVLTRLLETDEVKSALIFARTKARAQELSDELVRRGYPAAALHGDLNQSRREVVLNRFRENRTTLLVATDVAARGLDIENVSHVFNYDLPGDPEDYVHRIGRTGRAGRKGRAITFITPRERSRQGMIEAYTRQKMTELPIPSVEEIQTLRDEHFITRLSTQMAQTQPGHEKEMLQRLAESGMDLLDLAAAAVQLARAGENDALLEEIIPIPERRDRKNRQPADTHLHEGPSGSSSRPAHTRSNSPHQNPGRFEKSPRRTGTPAGITSRQGGQETGMVRLWMNLGNAQGIRPGDIVGAIAGEVGIPGKAIGEIDIHRDHTFVDVSADHVKRVLKESRGRYNLRGKPVLLKLAD